MEIKGNILKSLSDDHILSQNLYPIEHAILDANNHDLFGTNKYINALKLLDSLGKNVYEKNGKGRIKTKNGIPLSNVEELKKIKEQMGKDGHLQLDEAKNMFGL